MLNTYQVYVIKKVGTDEPVYVGRTKQTLYQRFKQHILHGDWVQAGHRISGVQENLTLQEADTLTEMLIQQYRTRERGYNRAGPVSVLSKPLGVVNKDSAEISDPGNARPILCLNDGSTYPSMRAAAKALGLLENKVSLVCQGVRPHTRGFRFRYL